MTNVFPRLSLRTALALTLMVGGAAGCISEPANSQDEDAAQLGEVSQAFSDDPSDSQLFGKPCLHKHKYQGASVRVYFRCPNSEPGPLAIVLRAYGTNYDAKKYNYLLKHLARNGYTAASIEYLGPSGGQSGAASFLRGFLDNDLLGSWSRAHTIDPSKLALIGHSRGGYTARALAENLANDSNPWTVRALVNLAASGAGSNVPSGATTNAFLVIQGATDGDILPDSSFQHFNESDASPLAFTSMKLVHGADHAAFVADTSDSAPETEAAKMTKGYILAFLDAHVRGNSVWYDDYIRGELVPNNNMVEPTIVTSQYRDAFTHSIDTFEDGTVGTNDLGGGVFRSAGIYNQSVSTWNDTQLLNILALYTSDHITWRIPSAHGNVSHLRKLSIRIGQSTGDVSDDLTMQIRNNGVWSPEVRLVDWGTIAQPELMCIAASSGGSATCYAAEQVPRVHMSTIAIPASEFGLTNDVERVRLRFRGDAVHKNFRIDDIAFAEEAAWP